MESVPVDNPVGQVATNSVPIGNLRLRAFIHLERSGVHEVRAMRTVNKGRVPIGPVALWDAQTSVQPIRPSIQAHVFISVLDLDIDHLGVLWTKLHREPVKFKQTLPGFSGLSDNGAIVLGAAVKNLRLVRVVPYSKELNPR